MLYLTCTTITSVDLAQYGVALAEDWVSVECGTRQEKRFPQYLPFFQYHCTVEVKKKETNRQLIHTSHRQNFHTECMPLI